MTLKPVALIHAVAVLRDDAREVVAAQPMHEQLGYNPWLDVAADLATITSSLMAAYVDGLDAETRRIVELAFSSPMAGGGR